MNSRRFLFWAALALLLAPVVALLRVLHACAQVPDLFEVSLTFEPMCACGEAHGHEVGP